MSYPTKFSNKYVERLYNEWITHENAIIAVDFDDTIYPFKMQTENDLEDTINLIKDCKSVGAYITIFTASDVNRHPEILRYCESKGIKVDSINENAIELPYGHEGKIYYNINLCDRSGLEEAKAILREAMYLVRAYKAGRKLDNPGSTEF